MISEILKASSRMYTLRQKLKKESPIYPEVLTYEESEEGTYLASWTYLSTLVRISRDGKWFLVHCLESCRISCPEAESCELDKLYKRFLFSCYQIQTLYQLTGRYEEVDDLQNSEVDRMIAISSTHKFW